MSYYGNNLGALTTGGTLVYIDEPEAVDIEQTPFDAILIANRPILLAQFGIDAVYQPGVLNRSITAIIRYIDDDGQVAPIVRHRAPIVNVKVANDSTTGISAEEFEQGQIINMPPRKGADARDFSLARILKQDAGMITIEVH